MDGEELLIWWEYLEANDQDRRAEERMGIICSVIAACHGKKVRPETFMRTRSPKRIRDPKVMERVLNKWAATTKGE